MRTPITYDISDYANDAVKFVYYPLATDLEYELSVACPGVTISQTYTTVQDPTSYPPIAGT